MTSAACRHDRDYFQFNAYGQDACEIYTLLQRKCEREFVIPPANSSAILPYYPPQTPCGCNIIAYNLMAGCATCQRLRSDQWWLSESEWSGNCTSAAYDSSGIPDSVSQNGISIPLWAKPPYDPSSSTRSSSNPLPQTIQLGLAIGGGVLGFIILCSIVLFCIGKRHLSQRRYGNTKEIYRLKVSATEGGGTTSRGFVGDPGRRVGAVYQDAHLYPLASYQPTEYQNSNASAVPLMPPSYEDDASFRAPYSHDSSVTPRTAASEPPVHQRPTREVVLDKKEVLTKV
ncbi:hypothetical protein M408DRAFT_162351 [Serendipita vermifera MAFF 305830]|uniref:Uncharacterized protein n=1 Tax=Serendipita vermifera MAFF 305830 TaxID=933852 RepID=A0A0C3B884_SERVB|nr:hypothetical protein M408DRAFT_162351 [Serendipita vermifera MAFF 305830]